MTASKLLNLVDAGDFRRLFIDELGWNNPDKPDLHVTVADESYELTQVAGYRGLRVWRCDELPDRRAQREIDRLVGKDNLERLVIFVGRESQEWRWPRRAQGGVNAKLLMHRHVIAQPDVHLDQQLRAIEIDLDANITLVELLGRMRAAFDVEAESASVQAARLMKRLYDELEKSKVSADDSTLLLARLLFLLFGDDSGMWKRDLFHGYLVDHTTDVTLHGDLMALFGVADTDELARRLPAGSPLADFRYINGGLFADHLQLPRLSPGFRDGLLSACEFDWQVISPAVFGSMFQTIKDKESRRHGGEHYTTEENILRTIRPLFLDELAERLEAAWNDKGQLTRLHNQLGQIRILDPACGCGNFLVVAYRELRALELELMKRRRDLDEVDGTTTGPNRAQLSFDVTQDIKVTLDHFFGIEIEEWPARIAETAMLLVDHLANQRMEEEFGLAPDRLPIQLAPTIKHGNALQLAWDRIVPPSDHVIVVGNPPFLGHATRNEDQAQDLRQAWRTEDISRLDYVTGWHAKTLDYFGQDRGRWAFVTTNSITQGDPVPLLFGPIFEAGWRISFAHRTFPWSSEASDKAAVHCVIVGFTRDEKARPRLFDYSLDEVRCTEATRINAYLVDGPNVLIRKRMQPLCPDLPPVTFGNMPRDGGNLIVENDAYDSVMRDEIAARFVRRYMGSEELLHNKHRWCLWLVDATPEEIARSPELARRVAAVKEFRQRSTAASTRQMAQTPHLFGQRPALHNAPYVVIPRVSSEQRLYMPVMHVGPEVIASDATFTAPDPTGYLFALISSAAFMSWQRTVGGRLKSDLRFSNTIVWNNFPVPVADGQHRARIIACGELVRDARAKSPELSLAQLYDPQRMSAALVAAHQELDHEVDELFGLAPNGVSEYQRQKILFDAYAKLDPSSS
jgi:hypothetical protein